MTPNAPGPLHLTDDDLFHLLDGAPMAVVMLAPDLRVRRFTPLAQELLGLRPTDVGCSFLAIRLHLDGLPDLGALLAKGIDGIASEHDVRDRRGRWCSLRLRSYRTRENEVDGVIVMLVDIHASLERSQGHRGIGLGHGSESDVRPPLAAGPPVPAVPEAGPTRPTSRALRVLVVDDNGDTRQGFSMLLEAAGHEVRTAHDGAAGILAALADPPDVVLLDIGLPELNGYEVARRIRQEPSLANVVLVALTGHGQATDRQQALQAGFDHHLVKPPDFARLEQILAGVAANAG